MNKLLRPKNSIKITALSLFDIPLNTATTIEESRKTRYYFIVCRDASCYLNIGGKECKLQKNQAIVLGPEAHFIIKPEGAILYPIIIFDSALKNVSFLNKVLNLSSLSGSLYKELIVKLMSRSAFKDREILLLFSLFEYLLNSLNINESSSKHKSNDYAIFTEAVRYIKENLERDISVNNMASYLCVSPSKLKRVFAKYSALSVHKFMLAVKTEKAKELLKSGLSSKEVSRRLGFENQNYFSAVFKRETGKSPSRYKND